MGSLVTASVGYMKQIMDATVGALGVSTYVGSPAAEGDLPPAYAAVAYGGDDRPGISGLADDRLAYGNDTVGDRWLVWHTISKASGDYGPIELLSDVEDLMDAYTDALEADETLGGLLKADGKAVLSTHEWTVEDAGNIATVFFQVDVVRRW